jgi:S1-C subfamily serine protease
MWTGRREGFSRTTIISVGGIIVVVVLGILSLILYLSENDSFVNIQGKRLQLAPHEMSKFRGRPKFDVKSDYQTIGIELLSLKDDSILVKLGLKQKDVIKSFNDVKITNLINLEEVFYLWYHNVKAPTDEIKIEIIRDNKPVVITYHIVK